MTEAEWLAASDTVALLAELGSRGPTSERKLRLFAVTCCRRSATTSEPRLTRALQVAELAADGCATPGERAAAREDVLDVLELQVEDGTFALGHVSDDRVFGVPSSADVILALVNVKPYDVRAASDCAHTFNRTSHYVLYMVREIFGNPFRPVRFDPAWRTDTALAVARQMYESREFGAAPILADALQDAGCHCETALAHCRAAKHVHVRGCWVVDLVLGKYVAVEREAPISPVDMI
jgi:hypothetical protein